MQATFSVSDEQWAQVVAYFDGASDPAFERAAIGRAVARFEQIAGEQTPIHRDGRKNYGAGPGKTDCLDESANTTTFLRLMDERGLLRHHRVMRRVLRSPLNLDIHWTAVIQEIDSRGAGVGAASWAVDSWYNANGIEPIIQPLQDWLKKKPVPGYYAEDAPARDEYARENE